MSKVAIAEKKVIPTLEPSRPEKFNAPYQHELMAYSDKIRSAGIQAGAQNRPGSLSKEMDVNENELRYRAEKKLNACQNHYENKLRELIAGQEKLEIELRDKSYALELQRLIAQCKPHITQLLDRVRGSLKDAKLEERAHEAALKSFKRLHRRNDPPTFPVSQRAHFITLATITMMEALFNIAFYGEFKGIATAVLIALGASIANVAVSAFAGTLWRFKNSIRDNERRLGWGYFAGWAIYTLYLNKFVAAFRASLEKVPADATDAIARASQMGSELTFSYPWHGFTALDITSWFLLILGTIVAVAAFLKAYHADDPYPRYGQLVRQHAKVRSDFLEEEEGLYDAVDTFLEDAEKTILGVSERTRNTFAAFVEGSQAIYKAYYDYQVDTDSIAKDFDHLIKVYREANKAARTTPVPPTFAKPIELETPELNVPLRWQKKALEKLKGSLQNALHDVQGACTRARRDVTNVSRGNRKMIDDLLKDIDHEAKDSLARD